MEVAMEAMDKRLQATDVSADRLGVVTAVFLLVIAWRSVLSSMRRSDLIDAAQEHMAREQREW